MWYGRALEWRVIQDIFGSSLYSFTLTWVRDGSFQTQLEPSLFSMTTLLVPRHGAHAPFHLVAAQLCQPCLHGAGEQVLG